MYEIAGGEDQEYYDFRSVGIIAEVLEFFQENKIEYGKGDK